ncbi:MAG TPA: NUDIX hydrolase [Ramlibacter sp.]|nr:NUDIX hydrolase [Ramlibacter sp.]
MSNRWRPSVTVAAVIERDGRFLMIEEDTSDGLRINNPAGHLEPGETPAEACAREALEETTWGFRPTALLGIYFSRFQRTHTGEDVTYLRFAFTGELGDPVPGARLDHGIVRTLWMTAEELRATVARHRSPLVLRCLEDYLAGVRLPLAALYADPSIRSPGLPAAETDD